MSVYYEIKEHLQVADTQEHWIITDLAVSQLCLLGSHILSERTGYVELTAVADGETYCFTGNNMTEDYHKLIRALRNAKSLEIISSYGYFHSVLDADPGPFPMVELLDAIARDNPEELHGMFYSMYNNADCAEGAGAIAAFGEKGGRLYTGHVAFQNVDAIPDGHWCTPSTAVCYDTCEPAGSDPDSIEAVCRRMCEFSNGDDLTRTVDGTISFFLNNLCIKTDEQLKAFLQLLAQLIDLTDGNCGLIGELADISGSDVKMLRFDAEADGSYCLQMAAVAE